MSVRKLNLFGDSDSDKSVNSETKNPNNEFNNKEIVDEDINEYVNEDIDDGFIEDDYDEYNERYYTRDDYYENPNKRHREDYNSRYSHNGYRYANRYNHNRNYNSRHYNQRDNYTDSGYDYREEQFQMGKKKKSKPIDNSDKAIKTRGIIRAFVGTFKIMKGTAKGITNLTKNIGKTLNEQSQPKKRSGIDMKTKIFNLNNAIKNKVNNFKQNTKAQVGVLLGLSALALGLVFLVVEKGSI